MQHIIEALKAGKTVIHNTDTCLGMAVDIANQDAVELLYKIKQMPFSKPVSILCSDINMAYEYGVFPERALHLAEKYLPGALTLIVPRTDALPEWINPGMESVGVRIPDDELSLSMARELGNPVTTTSCNISGQPVCTSKEEVEVMFAEHIENGDVVIAFEGSTGAKVSTILKITQNSNIEIIRQGAVDVSEDLECVED